MFILVDSDGRRLRGSVDRFTEPVTGRRVIKKTSQDIIYEMIDNITRLHGIRKMINKYSKADVLVVHNCEDFRKKRYTLKEFSVFLEEVEKKDVKIILTIEKTLMALLEDLKEAHKKYHPREKDQK